MKKNNRIKKESLLICVTWITYFTVYLGRLNISACIRDMAIELQTSKESVGIVVSAFFLAYGIGQIFSGIFGDYVTPVWLVFLGIMGSGITNSILGFLDNIVWMSAVWFANGIFQSFIWGPMARFISEQTSPDMSAKICLILSTTGPAGMLCAYGYSALCLRYLNWRYCFWGVSGWTLISACIWLCGCRKLMKERKISQQMPEVKITIDRNCKIDFGRILMQSGFGGIILVSCIHGILKDGISTWIPTYLSEQFQISSDVSVIMTMILPIVNLFGVFWADCWNRKWFHTEVKTVAVFFEIVLMTVLCMIFWGDCQVVFSLVFLGIITTVMTGINTLIISLIPLHFKRYGKISTVIGILNLSAYLGTAIASYGTGWIAERWGWNALKIYWCVCAAIGGGISFKVYKKWDSFRAGW